MRIGLATIAPMIALLGCADLERRAGGPQDMARATASPARSAGATVDGLRRVEDVSRGILFVKPDHHIGSYDAFMIEPFTISYRRGVQPLGSRDAKKLANYLHSVLVDAIGQSDIDYVRESGECVLGLQIHLVELEVLDRGQAAGAASSFLSSAGSVTMVFEFHDSTSGQALIRYGQRRVLPGGQVVGMDGRLSSRGLASATGDMLNDIGQALATVLPVTTRLRKTESCIGKVGHIAGIDAKGVASPAMRERLEREGRLKPRR